MEYDKAFNNGGGCGKLSRRHPEYAPTRRRATCSGMKPCERRCSREHARLVGGERAEACPYLRLGSDPSREVDVGLMVSCLRGEEPAVEGGERGVVECAREEPHALAASRLDERRAEERVDESLGLVRADRPQELGGIWARHQVTEPDAARGERRQHLLEVRQLLAREPGERHEQRLP